MQYMGSKRKIAKYLLPILTKNRQPGQWYVEPFCGGLNMLEHVENPRLAGDAHPYLIAMWEALQGGWAPPGSITEEYYRKVKMHKDTYPSHVVGFVGFCSFGSKWFGGFPRARGRDVITETHRNIMKQVPKIKGVEFHCAEYYDLPIPRNSIVYCDPPYAGTTGYATKSFDHEFFWEWVRQLGETGRTVYVSEYTAPEDFECVFVREQKTTVNTNNQLAVERLWRPK